MAVYQPRSDLLAAQIESLKSQTESGWTCLIGLDGTDLGTEEMVRSFIGQDPRFTVRSFSDRVGFYRNFERILMCAPPSASWVALADQDDEWQAEKLAVLVPELAHASLAMGQARVRREGDESADGLVITARKSPRLSALLVDNQVTGSLAVIRAELLARSLPFPEATDQAFHDHWLGVCAVLEGGISVVDHVVQDYVQHGGNVIGEEKAGSFRDRMRRLESASGSSTLVPKLDYVRKHRWGWRVNMARSALVRYPTGHGGTLSVLEAFAADRVSVKLFAILLSDCIARRTPFSRMLALLVGSAWSRKR